jgi:hypothetical protein
MSRPVGLLLLLAVAAGSEPMAKPRYADGNQLLRPDGYREWRFVAANYGMGYKDGQPEIPKNATFHNIFMQPEAFQKYAETGEFPEGTMLVMEVYRPGTNASINKRGIFQDQFVGVEVALKDSSKFAEKWAYFNFIGSGGTQLTQSKAFAKDACWKCHNEHGAKDNVFVQFYPSLREARKN